MERSTLITPSNSVWEGRERKGEEGRGREGEEGRGRERRVERSTLITLLCECYSVY